MSEPNTNTTEAATSPPDVKTYTFRAIPPDLHKWWKTIASAEGKTMEEIAFIALRQYIARQLNALQTGINTGIAAPVPMVDGEQGKQ